MYTKQHEVMLDEVEANSMHDMLLSIYSRLKQASDPVFRLYGTVEARNKLLMEARHEAYAALSRFESYSLDAEKRSGYKSIRKYETVDYKEEGN